VRVQVLPAVRAQGPDDVAPYRDAGVDLLVLPLFGRDRDSLARSADAIARLAA